MGGEIKFDSTRDLPNDLAGGGLRALFNQRKHRVYVCAGVNMSTMVPNHNVHRFCVVRQKWMLPINALVLSPASVIVRGRLLLIGGHKQESVSSDTNTLAELTSESEGGDYTWDEDKWPPMKTMRSAASACVFENTKLIVTGGYIITSHDKSMCKQPVNTVEILDLDEKRWTGVARLSMPLRAPSSVCCSEYIYVLGGLTEKGILGHQAFRCKVSDLIASTAETRSPWTSIQDMPHGGIAVTTFRDKVLIVGGETETEPGVSNKIHCYAKGGQWKPVGTIQKGRLNCAAVTLPNTQLMVVGGITANDLPCNTVEISSFYIY